MKILIFFIFTFYCQIILASTVQVSCPNWQDCKEIEKEINTGLLSLKNKKKEINFLKSLALNSSFSEFKMLGKIRLNGERLYKLFLTKKSRYKLINLKTPNDLEVDNLKKILGIKSGDYINLEKIKRGLVEIEKTLQEKGYIGIKTSYSFSGLKHGPVLNISVLYKDIIIIEDVLFEGDRKQLPKNIMANLLSYKGNNFNKIDLKIKNEEVKQELFLEGFYKANVKLGFKDGKRRNSKIVIFEIDLNEKTNIHLRGNRYINRDSFFQKYRRVIQNEGREVNEKSFKSTIIEIYKERGIYGSKIFVEKRHGTYSNGTSFVNFYINIKEGSKIKVNRLRFYGNLKIDVNKLKKLFYKKASSLASNDYLDEIFLDEFSNILKNYFFKNGYILATISKPQILIASDKKTAEVSYTIKERQQCIVSDIVLANIPKKLVSNVIKELKNKPGKPLNIVDLEKDLAKALEIVRDKGYFFAKIINLAKKNIINYQSNYTKSKIFIEFDLGRKMIFQSLVVSGNHQTRSVIIERENKLKKGDVVTPKELKKLRDHISSLGIFSHIHIVPYTINSFSDSEIDEVNLLVQVQEKEFGSGELAPGFRTDLGAKLSFNVTYRNLWGRNHSIALKTQVNRRLTLSELDERRKNNGKHRAEGLMRLSYTWPYLTRFFNGGVSFSYQRKRFSSFDADIWKLSPQINKQFTDFFSSYVKYQFERIRQFDATEEKDRETFRVGSITPSFQFDFRDNSITPRSGSFFSLSWEFANPFFLSKKEENSEINFSKIVSRNRFYYPLFDKVLVLAFSVSGGYQVNYADSLQFNSNGQARLNEDGSLRTVGYIPSIKVFRLDGFDVLRGFTDTEANRLDNGGDINEVRVQGSAYFTNIKFEPRYYLNDSIILGCFFDAGHVYLNTFKPLNIRSSVGVSFKFLTPVGTLDFDYGVKTQRKRLSDGTKESFGRFHLYIGFF